MWSRQKFGSLWIKGHPRVGKSTVLKYAYRAKKKHSSAVVASFFFRGRGISIQKNSLGLFRSLLHQILQQIPTLLQKLARKYQTKTKKQGPFERARDWHANELQEFFESEVKMVAKEVKIRIYIDALDEGGEETATRLIDVFQCAADSISVCFSCRHYPLIVPDNQLEIFVEHENTRDIEVYVSSQLERHVTRANYKELIEGEILERSSRNFQRLVLTIPRIKPFYRNREPIEEITKKIREISQALEDLYRQILEDMDHEAKAKALRLFRWIFFEEKSSDCWKIYMLF